MSKILLKAVGLVFALQLSVILSLYSQDTFEGYFESGNHAYDLGDYSKAIELYAEALEIGESMALHYNLAGAYFKSGMTARSVYHYTRALMLNPSNPEVVANLEFVRDAVGLAEADQPFVQWLAYRVNMNIWAVLAVLSFWLTLFLFCFPKMYGRDGVFNKSILGLSAVLFVFSAVALYGWYQEKDKAVVLANEVKLRVSPTSQGQVDRFMLGGSIVKVLESHGEYTRVAYGDDKIGWCETAALGFYFDS